jgi:hypothetical protein
VKGVLLAQLVVLVPPLISPPVLVVLTTETFSSLRTPPTTSLMLTVINHTRPSEDPPSVPQLTLTPSVPPTVLIQRPVLRFVPNVLLVLSSSSVSVPLVLILSAPFVLWPLVLPLRLVLLVSLVTT